MLVSHNTHAIRHHCECGNEYWQFPINGVLEYKQYMCANDKMMMYPEWTEIKEGIKITMGMNNVSIQ
jgi:hypothetical protein